MTIEKTAVDACTEAELALQSYLDGVLSTSEKARVELHLAECVDCRCAYRFEARFRQHIKQCCQGPGDEVRCREELRERLERCREQGS
jgi:predicted anti-sigma-YlaC factor YlaD